MLLEANQQWIQYRVVMFSGKKKIPRKIPIPTYILTCTYQIKRGNGLIDKKKYSHVKLLEKGLAKRKMKPEIS